MTTTDAEIPLELADVTKDSLMDNPTEDILTDWNQHSSPLNEHLQIITLGERGPGNNYTHYHVNLLSDDGITIRVMAPILFQNGSPQEVGFTGITNEVLLAIVLHRLACCENGDFASAHSDRAYRLINAGLNMLKSRTKERMDRGVEGQLVA